MRGLNGVNSFDIVLKNLIWQVNLILFEVFLPEPWINLLSKNNASPLLILIAFSLYLFSIFFGIKLSNPSKSSVECNISKINLDPKIIRFGPSDNTILGNPYKEDIRKKFNYDNNSFVKFCNNLFKVTI